MPADTFELGGKVAIVTGSGRENGIGAAIARTLARNGASVTIHHVSDGQSERAGKTAQAIRDEFGAKVALVQADITTVDGANKIVTETLEQLETDHIDILVNNAGRILVERLQDVKPEGLQQIFATNVYGPIFLTQAVVELGKMPRGGRIINMGSIVTKTFQPLLPIYNASKAALDILTVQWAGELGRTHGITVNTLAPGPVVTDINKDTPEVFEALVAQQRGADRVAVPQDIADAVLLITSEKSHWITAQWIAVDAGTTGD
ncbi:putative short-chain dehydrogenase [Hypoxylon sp. FL0890]|nr:putative short-chain dehydrogenase [Hypoxylon sp. FL0890]